MKCDFCGAETNIHVTELDVDGTSVSRHLCEQHAREAGLEVPSSEQIALSKVSQLRSLSEFIRTNKRMPSATELVTLGGFGDLSNSVYGTEQFDRQLDYLDNLADFIENHRRFPTEEELPDPF